MEERQKQWEKVAALLTGAAMAVEQSLTDWPPEGLPELRAKLEEELAVLQHASVEANWLTNHIEIAEEGVDLERLMNDPDFWECNQ